MDREQLELLIGAFTTAVAVYLFWRLPARAQAVVAFAFAWGAAVAAVLYDAAYWVIVMVAAFACTAAVAAELRRKR